MELGNVLFYHTAGNTVLAPYTLDKDKNKNVL